MNSKFLKAAFATAIITLVSDVQATVPTYSPQMGLRAGQSRLAYFTPQLAQALGLCAAVPTVGTGGDDVACINAGLSAVANTLGNTLSFKFPALPPGQAYNICASSINIPTRTSIEVWGSGAADVVQVQAGCATPPATVFNAGSESGYSRNHLSMHDFTIDGSCLASHDLDMVYTAGFSPYNMIFRNAASGGSNLRIQAGFQNNVGLSNMIENSNDYDRIAVPCYTTGANLPNYGLENYGSDSNFTGLYSIGSAVASFYDGGAGDNTFGGGTHGWGPGPTQGAGYDLREQYTYWLGGAGDKVEGVADGFTVAGVRVSANKVRVNNVLFETAGTFVSTAVGIMIDAGINGTIATGNVLNALPAIAQEVVFSAGYDNGTSIIHDNFRSNNAYEGDGAGASAENFAINPDFAVDQIHAGVAANYTATGAVYFADGWEVGGNDAAVFNVAAVNTAAGCASEKYGAIITTTTPVTPSGAQFSALIQPIDSARLADMFFGYAQAKPLMLSFWIGSSANGTLSVSVINGAHTRAFLTSVPIFAAGCKYYAIPIPGDTAGTWAPVSGVALATINFDLGSSGAYQSSTVNQWQTVTDATRAFEVPGTTQISATNGASITVTGVRLRQGVVNVPWIRKSFAEQLNDAQLYVRSNFPVGVTATYSQGVANATCITTSTYPDLAVTWQTPMSGTPTITVYNPVGTVTAWYDKTDSANITANINPGLNTNPLGFEISGASAPTTAQAHVCVNWIAKHQL